MIAASLLPTAKTVGAAIDEYYGRTLTVVPAGATPPPGKYGDRVQIDDEFIHRYARRWS